MGEPQEGKSRGGGRFVVARLGPAISIRKAQRADYRDGRDKPGHDQLETATTFALLFWGAHNPLIRHYFLGVFRFAQMALADARNVTHGSIGIKS
jgi:hypothetical protein